MNQLVHAERMFDQQDVVVVVADHSHNSTITMKPEIMKQNLPLLAH